MNTPLTVPWVKLNHLDQLWFQITGTLCNLTCHHCFISCSPKTIASVTCRKSKFDVTSTNPLDWE